MAHDRANPAIGIDVGQVMDHPPAGMDVIVMAIRGGETIPGGESDQHRDQRA